MDTNPLGSRNAPISRYELAHAYSYNNVLQYIYSQPRIPDSMRYLLQLEVFDEAGKPPLVLPSKYVPFREGRRIGTAAANAFGPGDPYFPRDIGVSTI